MQIVYIRMAQNATEMADKLRRLTVEIDTLGNLGLAGIVGGRVHGVDSIELYTPDDHQILLTNAQYLAGAGWHMVMESRLAAGTGTVMFAKGDLVLYYHMSSVLEAPMDQLFAGQIFECKVVASA